MFFWGKKFLPVQWVEKKIHLNESLYQLPEEIYRRKKKNTKMNAAGFWLIIPDPFFGRGTSSWGFLGTIPKGPFALRMSLKVFFGKGGRGKKVKCNDFK